MRRAAYAIALVFLIATAFLSRNSESPALQFELYAIEAQGLRASPVERDGRQAASIPHA